MTHKVKNNKGQSFIEFVFLMLTIMSMSFLLLKGVNGGVGDRWQKFVAIITENPASSLQFYHP